MSNRHKGSTDPQGIRYKVFLIQAIVFVIPCFVLAYYLYEKEVLLEGSNALVFLFVLSLILGGFLLLRQILDKVAGLAEAAHRLDSGDIRTLEEDQESPELREISRSINGLLARLEIAAATANQRLYEMLCIKEFAEAVRGNRDRNGLMRLLLEKAMAASGAQNGAVFTRSANGREFNLVGEKGAGASLPMETGRPLFDIAQSGACQDLGRDVIAAPLVELGEAIGVVVLGAKRDGNPFSEHDRNVLSVMAEQLSLGCEAGHLAGELKQRIQDLNRRTRELEDEVRIRHEAEEKLRNILESSSAISIISTDLEQKILYWNKGAENIFGFKAHEMAGKLITKIYGPDEHSQEILAKAREYVIAHKSSTSCEVREVSKDGSGRWIRLNLSARLDKDKNVVGILGIGEDVTERKRLERMLLHTEKMKAIGSLAGGVAHDFNNILTSVRAYSELAQFRIKNPDSVAECLGQILLATDRARELVRQILNFSKQEAENKRPIRLEPVVREAVDLLHGGLPATIEIQTDFQDGDGVIEADPTHIHQVVMNLGTNAAHAMAEKGGMLSVSLAKTTLDHRSQAADKDLIPGQYMRITVRDTGCGMPQKVLERIFEPYYTTRATGEGSGMGLAVVYGIVKQHGGGIVVRSAPGQGTAFDVYFPIVEADLWEEPQAEGAMPGGRESILFVDDEAAVTQPYAEILKDLGYGVAGFTQPLEALEHFRKNPESFDLIICDMTMPKITGADLAREALEIRPGIPVILCTGFSDQMNQEKAQSLGIRALLQKPLAVCDLAETIRKALGD